MGEYMIQGGELKHYGVKGMRWGVRRYQNPDGSLTDAGKRRIVRRLNMPHSSRNMDEASLRMFQNGEPSAKGKKLEREFDEIWDKRHRAEAKLRKAERNGDTKQIETLNKQIENLRREEHKNNLKRQIEFDKAVVEKWYPELASATLKDIRVSDTEAGRQFIIDNYLRPSQRAEQHVRDLMDFEALERKSR